MKMDSVRGLFGKGLAGLPPIPPYSAAFKVVGWVNIEKLTINVAASAVAKNLVFIFYVWLNIS